MKYTKEKEILDVIDGFENGTISREVWGHPEHLILAYHYSINYDLETALAKMREGIFRLLEAFEVDLTKEMPYHETLTVFWMHTVFEFAKNHQGYSAETINELITKFDKTYPARFYSHDRLFSDRARAEYVDPDIKQSQTVDHGDKT